MEENKIGFFKSFWYAITNFDKYKSLVKQKSFKVIIYIIIILLLVSMFVSMLIAGLTTKSIFSGAEYFEKEFPELQYKEGKLTVETDKPIILNPENNINVLNATFIIDPDASEEQEKAYLEKDSIGLTLILLFNDRLVIKSPVSAENTTYLYTELANTFGFTELDKTTIMNMFNDENEIKIAAALFLVFFAYMLITYTLLFLMDILLLSVLGLITCKLYRINLRLRDCAKIGIYALTLPMVLQVIYIYINTLTGFTITYFSFMYDIISYIYLITALLIIKNNKAKQDIGLIKEEKIVVEEDDMAVSNDDIDKDKVEKKKEEKHNKELNPTNPEVNPGSAITIERN